MRIVDKLIAQVRAQTENEEVSATIGISDSEFLQYLNDAQDRLQSVVEATHPTAFVKEKIIEAPRDQERYELPVDAYKKNAITTVEYSPSSNDDDYYHLEQVGLKSRSTSIQGFPTSYIRRSGAILLQPAPQSAGLLRLNYVKRINRLDRRRGKVTVSVLNSTARTITSLELDPASSSPVLDATTLNTENYICVVDRDGNMLMANIPIESVNASTGVVTISSGYSYELGESLPVGAYVVSGQDTSTHSEFPRMAERYLISYAAWKILKRDSSVDYQEQQDELLAMESDIINSFADIDDDVKFVPVLNRWDDFSN